MVFTELLRLNDIKGLQQIPKSDIHSHAGRGGNIAFLAERTGSEMPVSPERYASLEHMQSWFMDNIKPMCEGTEGQILRWEACFAEAKRNNIVRMALSFSRLDVMLVGGMSAFIEILEEYHRNYCPDTKFEPELTYGRGCNIDEEVEFIDEILSYNYFKSIDICNGEFQQPIENFVSLYRIAEQHKLVKKAHVGEFGSADDIERAVGVLGLSEVHHGIAAANSEHTMRFLEREKIQLNVCPSSNVMLNVVESYEKHPIGTLVHHGIPVTINTDDLLIFNQPVDREYMNLFKAGTLNAYELEEIRLCGLGK